MNKVAFCFCSLISSYVCAEAGYTQTFAQMPHQIEICSDLFWYSINVPIQDVKVKDCIFFGGIKLGYEYIKPWAWYADLEVTSAASGNHFDASQHGASLPHAKTQGFGSLEIRWGYTLAPQNQLWIPYISFGGFGISSRQHHRYEEIIEYLALGFRSMWSLNPYYGIGFNAKVYKSVYSEQKYRLHHMSVKNHHRYWGGELALPVMVHPIRHLDLGLEPYFLDLTFGQTQFLFGLRLSLNGRF